ncbi:B-lymphocyte antigen CD20-like isoform X2 [Malaclemys terrapin pileata]|uniref:B-lymphocyte antigen CD20-like isoform X2 n=1 Tax=Malaclemys terrapin pileata TaxID=2991368 RepID=UPI0023A807B1|nr:B-lymphocyte antigen CD20-like isoform X2 [Malaclemys terrapin pileata]
MAFPGTATNNVTQLIPPYTQRKFPRKNEALGAIQIIIALIHLGLGGILFFSSKESVPLCMASWYPFWGAGLFIISGSLSAAAATATNITEGLDKSQDHKAEFPLLSPPQPQSNNGTSPPWQ